MDFDPITIIAMRIYAAIIEKSDLHVMAVDARSSPSFVTVRFIDGRELQFAHSGEQPDVLEGAYCVLAARQQRLAVARH